MSNEGYKGEVWRVPRSAVRGPARCVRPNERRRVRTYRTSLNRARTTQSKGRINVFV